MKVISRTNHAFSLQVFMNIVLDEAFEEKQGGEKVAIGMVVCRATRGF
jgi:small nuclear ribonucleoprotein (snRNP)-like protein